MHGEFLKYRFPGKEIQTKHGFFKLLDAGEVPHGFVFSDFTGSAIYQFTESEEALELELYFSTEKPHVATPREYYLQAHELLNGINMFQMGKAVFSRIKHVRFEQEKLLQLFESLCLAYPSASVYLTSSKQFGTWIGASPELLMEVHKNQLFTVSLAGTKRTLENVEWGEKERVEQGLVTEFILENLKEIGVYELEGQGPYDVEAGPVTHLRTDISARIEAADIWKIAQSLHPTPAVSGFPRNEAMALIATVEPHNRSLYAGFFGLISAEKTQLFVNLRCAQLQYDNLYLYLGGGYTKQSIPENEWTETENKSRTLLNIIEKLR